MKQIIPADILTASHELPLMRPTLIAYIREHTQRLKNVNPSIGELIELIGKRTEDAHREVVSYTQEEFRCYVVAIILLLIRTIETAELRDETERQSVDGATEGSIAEANDLLARLLRGSA